MNKLTIIGNLTKDPELRATTTGINVCSFTVAVNRKKTKDNPDPDADFFRVSAWRGLGENCAKYLTKGSKVAATGPVTLNVRQGQDGKTYANMDVTAEDVEFLSTGTHRADKQSGMQVVNPDGNPFTQVPEDNTLPF